MFTLRVIADPSDPNDFASRDYRNYLFITATSIFHEISHVFFTYLMKGVGDTPPQTKAYVVGHEKKTEGESGSRLEQMVLGGVVYLYRDRDRQTPVDAVRADIVVLVQGQSFGTLADVCPSAARLSYSLRPAGIKSRRTQSKTLSNAVSLVQAGSLSHPLVITPFYQILHSPLVTATLQRITPH